MKNCFVNYKDNVTFFDRLFSEGKVDVADDENGATPLMYALMYKKNIPGELFDRIVTETEDFNVRSNNGWNALTYAIAFKESSGIKDELLFKLLEKTELLKTDKRFPVELTLVGKGMVSVPDGIVSAMFDKGGFELDDLVDFVSAQRIGLANKPAKKLG